MQRELARLDLEIDSLEAIGQTEISTDALPGGVVPPETPGEKVALFLNLFGTRRSVTAMDPIVVQQQQSLSFMTENFI